MTKFTTNVKYNNCYAYAFGDYDPHANRKRIPGNAQSPYTCKNVMSGVQQDYPNVKVLSSGEISCPDDTYKVYLAVDERTATNDFHFWRQDWKGKHAGMWTHKLGSSQPSGVDGSQRPISNPETSDKRLGKFHYDTTCGYFCVPK